MSLNPSPVDEEPLLIGCDPEFGYIKNQRTQQAIAVGDRFGRDSGGRVGEIRPRPGRTPGELLSNITATLKEGADGNDLLKTYFWKAGAMACEEPLGGHIHFGHSSLKGSSELRQSVADALDKTFSVVSLLTEDRAEAIKRRCGSTYGGLHNSRNQPHGMEYRVPSSWLVSPEVVKGNLATAYVVVDGVMRSPEYDKIIKALPMPSETDYKEYNTLNLMYGLKDIIVTIKRAPKYPNYKKSIDWLISLIVKEKTWESNRDMLLTWDLYIKKESKSVQTSGVPA